MVIYAIGTNTPIMEIAVVVILIISLLLGECVRLEVRKNILASTGAPSATLYCAEEQKDQNTIGQIRSLSIHTVLVIDTVDEKSDGRQRVQMYVRKSVVELSVTGLQTWASDNNYKLRSYLTGLVRQGRSSLSLTITPISCRDNLAFVCVASGKQGTADSNQGSIEAPITSQGSPVIKGGRRCPSHNRESYDRCDVYATTGETFDLRCKVNINLPLERNSVRWYLSNNDTTYNVGNAETKAKEIPDKCQGNLTSTLSYRHVPWSSNDVTIFCRVEYTHPNTASVMTKSAKITACTEEAVSQSYTLNEPEVAGVFLAGCVAMLIIAMVLAMSVACCGNTIKVYKKNKMAVTRM